MKQLDLVSCQPVWKNCENQHLGSVFQKQLNTNVFIVNAQTGDFCNGELGNILENVIDVIGKLVMSSIAMFPVNPSRLATRVQ